MEEVIQNLLDIMRDWWLGALENFPKVLAGILVLIISLYLARLAGVLTDKTLKKRDTDPELTVLLVRIIRWSVIALGIILALQQAGQDTSALLTGLGILGFTIGFALQDVSKNFVAGILLLLLQPFDLGDAIEVAGYSGTVKTVDLRATEILTFDGREVSIPNSEVFTNALVNFSRNTERRISLDINVGYNSDLEQVHRLAIDTITSLPGVLDSPAPQVVIHTFAASSIGLTIYYWVDTNTTSLLEAKTAGVMSIKSSFNATGITIPHPVKIVMDK
jgi:small-conductance mechanosensitive channel